MAGQADKKRAANAVTTRRYYELLIAFSNALYLLPRLYKKLFAAEEVDPLPFFSLVSQTTLFWGVSKWTFSGIDAALNAGAGYAYYQDVLFINIFVY